MNHDIHEGRKLHGFTCVRVSPLPDLRAEARLFVHDASGARFLHVAVPGDNENCLAVTFPTPPQDDTGAPHILEHSVLAGSRRFPVREPFFEMIKMSLATFINAYTAQDYTSYPVCSPVPKDFFNLAEVYLDAVFHPLLTPETFRREGHHLAFETPGDTSSALTVKGIVYSEMQGYDSDPEDRLYFLAHRFLYPDHPLGRESGGDPRHIPELDYEAFRAFHATRYHPSNALVFSYGDIPTADLAAFLDRSLAGFSAPGPAAFSITEPAAWTEPRTVEASYVADSGDSPTDRDFLTLHWSVGAATDPDASADWAIIDTLLEGHDAAPLRKALVDSGLGADTCMTGSGHHGWMQEFSVGLKGSRAERFGEFEALVRKVLSDWASVAPDAAAVEAAFQQLAYSTREIGNRFPLAVLNAANRVWPYGGDPLDFLSPRTTLDGRLALWKADPLRFGRIVREKLLDNPHLLRLVLRPDAGLAAREAAETASALAARRASMSPAELAEIDRSAAALEALNGAPNPPEKLALLPQLTPADLPPKPIHLPTSAGEIAGIPVLRNDVFSNGVNYMALSVDLTGLPDDLVPRLSDFACAWNKMGAAGQDFAAIAARRAACTGGLSLVPSADLHADGSFLPSAMIYLRVLDESADAAFDLLGDLLFGVDARDPDRLRDLLDQAIVACRESMSEEGLALSRSTSARHVSPVSAFGYDNSSNPRVLRSFEADAANFDACAERVASATDRLRAFLLDPRRWTVSFTGSDAVFGALQGKLAGWVSAMPAASGPAPVARPARFVPPAARLLEGVAVPGTVNHCSFAMAAPPGGDPRFALLQVGASLLSSEYCLPELRFKGHAYGAGAGYSGRSGTFFLYSGWDPHIAESLAIFDAARDYVASASWTQADVDRAIIACSVSAVRPLRPGAVTTSSLSERLRGVDDALIERHYDERRAATPATVRQTLLDLFDEGLSHSAVAVVASQDRLAAAGIDIPAD